MFISLNEFSAGEIHTAKSLSLIRPLAPHDEEFLIAGSSDAPIAIFLNGSYAYRHFATAGTDGRTGLIISDLRIEVDEESAFDVRFERAPLGALIRQGTELKMCVVREHRNGTSVLSLVSGLPSIGEFQAGFRRWQLVLGDSYDKRIVRALDASSSVPKPQD